MIQGLSKPQIAQLRELAARLVFNGVSAEVIVTTANELLDSGVYDDLLLAIVDSKPPILSNVEPCFRRFLEKVAIALPDIDTAVWQLLYFYISRIAASLDDPLLPLNEMINEVYYSYPFHKQPGPYIGESHGIHHLLNEYWMHDDLYDYENEIASIGKTGRQILDEVRKSTKRRAIEWLTHYGPQVKATAGWY